MLRQRMSATLIVFMRSFMRHLDTNSSDVPGFATEVRTLVAILAHEHGVERELHLAGHVRERALAVVHAVFARPRQLHRRGRVATRRSPVLAPPSLRRSRHVEGLYRHHRHGG